MAVCGSLAILNHIYLLDDAIGELGFVVVSFLLLILCKASRV